MLLRGRLETELHKIHTAILHMGTLAEEALHAVTVVLTDGNQSVAERIITEDRNIDRMQAEIEDHITRTIAMEQPVAADLRSLITCIKLVAEIERIGDHARHIARATRTVSRQSIERLLPRLQEMIETGIGMLHDTLTAFMDNDEIRAAHIADRDDSVDALHKLLYKEIMDYMQENNAYIDDGTKLIMICRYIERLGDHVTNMCECVVYAKTGSHIELNE